MTDVRLAFGFTACAIAAGTFYYDYTLGFEKTKQCTLYAVIAYFTLNTLLTWWIWWVEGRKVYVGERNGVKVRLKRTGEPPTVLLIRDRDRWLWRVIPKSIRRYTN